MNESTAIQQGNYFTIKDEVEKGVYMFLSLCFKEGVPKVLCIDEDGNEITLMETYLSDLERICNK